METFLSKMIELVLQIISFSKSEENDLTRDILKYCLDSELPDLMYLVFSVLKVYNVNTDLYVVISSIRTILESEYKINNPLQKEKLENLYKYVSNYFFKYNLKFNINTGDISRVLSQELIIPNSFNANILYNLTDDYILKSFKKDSNNAPFVFSGMIKGEIFYQDIFVVLYLYYMNKKYNREFIVF